MSSTLEDFLGKPAIQLILNKKRSRTEEEKKKLSAKIESSCNKFSNHHGSLTIDEYYQVIKEQHGVEVSKDEIKLLVSDLDKDEDDKISIKDFMSVRLISESLFREMDINNDGIIDQEELQLASKHLSPEEINQLLEEADTDPDGWLSFEEISKIIEKAKIKQEGK